MPKRPTSVAKLDDIAASAELDDLRSEAECRYLNKTNFYTLEWLDPRERKRFLALYKRVEGMCYQCQNNPCQEAEYCK